MFVENTSFAKQRVEEGTVGANALLELVETVRVENIIHCPILLLLLSSRCQRVLFCSSDRDRQIRSDNPFVKDATSAVGLPGLNRSAKMSRMTVVGK